MYSQKIINRFLNPYNAGGLRGANVTGKAGEAEYGDCIKIYLNGDEDNVIQTAKFKAFGSPVTIAVCDCLCDIVVNLNLDEALEVSVNDLINVIDVPEEKLSVLSLAIEALRNGIEVYLKKLEKQLKNS